MDKLIKKEDSTVTGHMVRVKVGEEKPLNAKLMSAEDVLKMQMKVIANWKPAREMWPFVWGQGILAGAAAFGAILSNNFCRRHLGLRNLGRMTTYGPTVGVPVIMASVFHSFIITNKILVGEFHCTVCIATRSGFIQSFFAAAYPLILAPITCLVVARQYHTYPVPSLTDRAGMLALFKKASPFSSAIFLMIAANFALGMFMAEREIAGFHKYLCPSAESLKAYDEMHYVPTNVE